MKHTYAHISTHKNWRRLCRLIEGNNKKIEAAADSSAYLINNFIICWCAYKFICLCAYIINTHTHIHFVHTQGEHSPLSVWYANFVTAIDFLTLTEIIIDKYYKSTPKQFERVCLSSCYSWSGFTPPHKIHRQSCSLNRAIVVYTIWFLGRVAFFSKSYEKTAQSARI